ncbi:outer membrane protein assembly factor BamC [Prodigiosinella aquatilis]|nr:outer membrane protein assembly factor BamC [Prodigiosinella sp. LS101]WJV55143.1 outer membrane protein assembly factor BamC [Prodigiosinella sp. LS101]WJV59503.1 outer membrane protein assembly factor BamC [Pectobacteriaceae bacterium C111]
MSSSLQKSMVAKVIGVSLVMLLAACSSDQRYKRQVSGDESYLKTPEHRALKVPAGMILPLQNGDYDIPSASQNGMVGKALDIRPPMQPLALLNGSRGHISGDTATLLLEKNAKNSQLWSQVTHIIQSRGFTIASRQDANQTLTTDWVTWKREDEDVAYQASYQITVQPQGYQLALVVKLLDLRQLNVAITDVIQRQRYASIMLNLLSNALEKQAQERADELANHSSTSLDVQSGADDSGLPLLVVRGTYAQVWDRLPKALENIDMKVTDRSKSQGSISITYKAPGSSTWDALGTKDPQLPKGDYKLQVGDLGNRSSLQFTDAKGHMLGQSQNDALVSVFQAAFNK